MYNIEFCSSFRKLHSITQFWYITGKRPVIVYYFNILIQFVGVMGSHITWMQFALRTSYSEIRKDDLMMVSWPKRVVKVKIKITYCCAWLKPKTICCLLFLFILVMVSLTSVSVTQTVKSSCQLPWGSEKSDEEVRSDCRPSDQSTVPSAKYL
jgi:hypothetical protein